MKSFRTSFIGFAGVLALLAGCTASEATNTGQSSNAVTAQATSEKPEEGRPHAGRPHHGPGRGGPDFLVFASLHENIDLTAEQRSTIEGLIEKDRPRERMKEARPAPDKTKTAELASAIRSGNIDSSKLKAGPQGASFMQERQAKSAEKLATLHATLTKEQRAALVDAITAKQAKHAERMGQMGERGAKVRDGHRPGPEGAPMGHLLDGLDLTEAQKEQLKTKLEANRPAPPSEADRAAMKAAMDAKLQSFKADTFDAKAFVAPPANGPIMKGGADHMAKGLAAVVSVLTAEQREKLAQKIEQGPPARK